MAKWRPSSRKPQNSGASCILMLQLRRPVAEPPRGGGCRGQGSQPKPQKGKAVLKERTSCREEAQGGTRGGSREGREGAVWQRSLSLECALVQRRLKRQKGPASGAGAAGVGGPASGLERGREVAEPGGGGVGVTRARTRDRRCPRMRGAGWGVAGLGSRPLQPWL